MTMMMMYDDALNKISECLIVIDTNFLFSVLPFIGHLGIADSNGVASDFQGKKEGGTWIVMKLIFVYRIISKRLHAFSIMENKVHTTLETEDLWHLDLQLEL